LSFRKIVVPVALLLTAISVTSVNPLWLIAAAAAHYPLVSSLEKPLNLSKPSLRSERCDVLLQKSKNNFATKATNLMRTIHTILKPRLSLRMVAC
jgi:hypothetical protein